jgi:glycosyltransferase involved in cell wall biosynthesis
MILITHQNNKVLKILDAEQNAVAGIRSGISVTKAVLQIAELYPETLIVWCEESYTSVLNVEAFQNIFHHKRILASYNPSKQDYLPQQIGYRERSYYLKIKKDTIYPTWQTSSLVGGIYSDVLQNLKDDLQPNDTFDYFLNSLGKRAMVEGLFCYSEPKLLKDTTVKSEIKQANRTTLFKFVKHHYKWVWVFLLSFCYCIYEKKIGSVIPLFQSIFYRQRNDTFNLETIVLQSTRTEIKHKTVDVIIPTIGRKKYLYDVLKDLAKQTIVPKNVIIVEQNPGKTEGSLLDYLKDETWPFNIKHTFTHQTGVCNARNIALAGLESEWCFLADDDIRFPEDLLEHSFQKIETYGITALNYLCLQEHQKQTYFKMAQTTVFGSGSSLVKTEVIKNKQFDMAFEFGFGEDSDFGMQIRNNGGDVIFVPDIKIKHLKAPIGGYRTKVKQLWDDDAVQPKPSPTVALLYRKYFTDCQLKGYKILLFIRHYKSQPIKNPFKYIKNVKKQWNKSIYWSTVLNQEQNA